MNSVSKLHNIMAKVSNSNEDEKIRNKKMNTLKKERLRKKRENPEVDALIRAKERERWKKRRKDGKVLLAQDLNKKELEKRRQKQREASKKYYEKKKMSLNNNNVSDSTNKNENQKVINCDNSLNKNIISRQQIVGRKKILRSRSKTVRLLKRAEQEKNDIVNQNKHLHRKIWRLQKQVAKLKNSVTLSPKSKVRKFLKGKKVSKIVEKKLIFSEGLETQLKESINNSSPKSKKRFYSTFSGKVLKKFKLLSNLKSSMNLKQLRKFRNKKVDKQKVETNPNVKNVIQEVKQFYFQDDVSVCAPGKKDVITRHKIKKQKRYLTNCLKALHSKFLTSSSFTLSYAAFCKLRPFWVVSPNVSARDTCLCLLHENERLLVHSIHYAKLIKETNLNQVLSAICCDSFNEFCLLRKCQDCKCLKVSYLPLNDNQIIFRKEWITAKEERISGKTNKPITVQVTKKRIVSTNIKDIKQLFQKSLPSFMSHEARIQHQYKISSDLKESLSDRDLLLHVDFSQNFEGKYGKEPQSVHFGASREQITLHTGVVYTKGFRHSFCTLSQSLRHDAAAIIAHLLPILRKYLEKFPEVNHLHFFSDGPTTQYKNKTSFYLFSTYLPKVFKNVEKISYNFTEAGHGKSCADGVGAVIKRTADQATAHGADVENIGALVKIIQEQKINIYTEVVNVNDIEEIDKHIPDDIETFKGTMRAPQWTWKKGAHDLYFNEMSCYTCTPGQQCSHFHIGRHPQRRVEKVKKRKISQVQKPPAKAIKQSKKRKK